MNDEEYDQTIENHRDLVSQFLSLLINELEWRGTEHDITKLTDPERSIFKEVTPKLKKMTYGSDEYYEMLKKLKPALEHHSKRNRHHPEHFENGVDDMNLVDIVEMFCDWMAATKRHEDGDIMRSIDINEGRFNISYQLSQIFRNTVEFLEEEKRQIAFENYYVNEEDE